MENPRLRYGLGLAAFIWTNAHTPPPSLKPSDDGIDVDIDVDMALTG